MNENNDPRKFIPIMQVAGKPIQTPTTILEKWIFYSSVISKVPPLQFLLPIIHMLGYQDSLLRKWESDFFSRPPSPDEQEMIAANYKMFESYLWVLSAYEVVRTLSQRADHSKGLFSISATKKIRETKHKLEEVRIPLAKLEPRKIKGETALALPGRSKDSFGWIVEPGSKFYSRCELAETVIELFKFMHEHDTDKDSPSNQITS
jgi:hypothetical protein